MKEPDFFRRHAVLVATVAFFSGSSGAAVAQGSAAQSDIDQMVRKAEGREKEEGFCQKLAWPPGLTLEQFTTWLRAANETSWKVNLFANGNCQYDRVTRIDNENGGKCVIYTYYTCSKGGTCGVGQSTDCLDSKGVFAKRR